MKELRLLERISNMESMSEYTRQTQVETLLTSIIEHLRRILNTRQGGVPIDEDFGVPDFTNLAGTFVSGETEQIIDDMTRMITRYEPRLKSVHIQLAENGREVFSLNFSLNGLVEINNRDIPIRLSTRVSSNGRVYLARY